MQVELAFTSGDDINKYKQKILNEAIDKKNKK